MIRMEFAKRIEEALPRLACVTAAIAMATLLALAGCATEEAPAGAEAPAPEAAEEAPEQDVAGTPAESEQEAQLRRRSLRYRRWRATLGMSCRGSLPRSPPQKTKMQLLRLPSSTSSAPPTADSTEPR